MLKKILIKLNIVRKWLRSFFTSMPWSVILFNKYYYRSADKIYRDTRWLGVQTLKPPTDLWTYQEIIFEVRPDIIIECGTYLGGSAFFLANIFDLIGQGRVITVDIVYQSNWPKHDRIEYLTGSSVDDQMIKLIKSKIAPGDKVLVILDSNHRRDHVFKEMEFYGQLVTKGSYLIVEDTNINGHPVYPSFGPGPMEAVNKFLSSHLEFKIDSRRDKFGLSFNPRGYLKKIN
ncbi:MAG: CmcI family methyltransferase [bacterium]|nr:CmcI family methyltransferase [bacterium]